MGFNSAFKGLMFLLAAL